MKTLLPLLILLSLVLVPTVTAEEEKAPDWGFTELDEVELGEQLTGDRVSHYDLRRRVVVLFQWGITCPISTGAFPYVNRLVAKYRDRGVAFVGFQVRRNPDVLANNVMWYVEHLRPEFPICRLGNDWEWPAKYLPWVIVFDTQGKRIHAANVPGIDKVLDAALADGTDWMIGGPYKKLAKLADEMKSDRDHLGPHLAALRRLLAKKDADPEAIAEAKAMLDAITRYEEWQLARASLDTHGPVEEAAVLATLAERFDGDALGERAKKALTKITAKGGYAKEVQAHGLLERALLSFRRLPPAGNYAYNMDYSESADPSVLSARSRILAEFRVELTRINALNKGTQAAADAEDLLFEHSMPFLGQNDAITRMNLVDKLIAEGKTPFEEYEAYLLLYEISEGYFEQDDVAGRVANSLKELRSRDLTGASEAYRRLSDEEARLRKAVALGGSALPKEEADSLIARFEKLSKEAGALSRLARRNEAFVARLLKSYEGPAHLGIAFDRRFRGTGARISWVYPRSAAERAGLLIGDIIVGFNEREVTNGADIAKLLAEVKVGQAVNVEIQRGDTGESIKLTMGRRP